MSRRREHLRIVSSPLTPDVAGRVPPNDLEAEGAVLSAIMLDRDALDRVLEILRPEHFYAEANQRVFQAAEQVAASLVPVNNVSIHSWIKNRNWPIPMGSGTWAAYLAGLADAAPLVKGLDDHTRGLAGIVHEKWRLRQLIATCQRIAAEGYGDVGEVQPFIASAHDAVGDLRSAAIGENLDRLAIGAIAEESHAETLILQGPFEGAFVSTGIESVDAVTGLYPSQVAMLGAEKGIGKSTLARWITDRVARAPRRLIDGRADCPKCQAEQPCTPEHGRQPRGVLVLALEGSRRDWSDYSAGRACGLNLFDRSNGRWTPPEHARFTRELEKLRGVPIVIDDRKDLNRANLGARVRAWRDWFAKRGAVLELVVLDYFQIGDWERGGDSREQDLSEAGRVLIRLATDAESDLIGMAWLVITALNKDGATRESGALEYHADIVWRLSRGRLKPTNDAEKALYLWIEKQRRGPSQVGAAFWFDPTRGAFW